MNYHLAITSNKSFSLVQKEGLVAIYKENINKPLHLKTKADIMSDLSCIRKGDPVLFYNTDEKGYTGIYEVTQLPFFDEVSRSVLEKEAPYRFIVKPIEGLSFSNYISEYELFNEVDVTTKLITIFYKKTLQRGKAITHLLPEEYTYISNRMIMYCEKNIVSKESKRYKKEDKCLYLKPNFINTGGDQLKYEKELEWWLCYNIDKNKCSIINDDHDIECFLNYCPTSIGGGNIDFLLFNQYAHRDKRLRNRVSLVELKRGICYRYGLEEVEKYVRWVDKHITNNMDIIQPFIIAHGFSEEVVKKSKYWNLSIRKPILVKYRKIKNDIVLSRL